MIFVTIVTRGKANAILERSQAMGAASGTILLGQGTSRSRHLATRHLAPRPKEVVLIRCDGQLAASLHAMVASTFAMARRHKGIAFTIPFNDGGMPQSQTVDAPWQLIITIVEQGRAQACIRGARSGGARGGTVIHGRGAGIPAHFWADLVIEPQKEIVLVLTPRARAQAVKERIIEDLELEKMGKGMLFALPVIETTGLVETIEGQLP